ncbi:hypothetical protein HDU97_002755 [Phlyctochytrium planicorne]|nr:hypothetical protein HDU97_002755 [Phlyctochytrium planicorne]
MLSHTTEQPVQRFQNQLPELNAVPEAKVSVAAETRVKAEAAHKMPLEITRISSTPMDESERFRRKKTLFDESRTDAALIKKQQEAAQWRETLEAQIREKKEREEKEKLYRSTDALPKGPIQTSNMSQPDQSQTPQSQNSPSSKSNVSIHTPQKQFSSRLPVTSRRFVGARTPLVSEIVQSNELPSLTRKPASIHNFNVEPNFEPTFHEDKDESSVRPNQESYAQHDLPSPAQKIQIIKREGSPSRKVNKILQDVKRTQAVEQNNISQASTHPHRRNIKIKGNGRSDKLDGTGKNDPSAPIVLKSSDIRRAKMASLRNDIPRSTITLKDYNHLKSTLLDNNNNEPPTELTSSIKSKPIVANPSLTEQQQNLDSAFESGLATVTKTFKPRKPTHNPSEFRPPWGTDDDVPSAAEPVQNFRQMAKPRPVVNHDSEEDAMRQKALDNLRSFGSLLEKERQRIDYFKFNS